MQRTITMTEERFLQLMEVAYRDGFDDGANWTTTPEGPATSDAASALQWPESVSKDAADAVIQKVRAGGKP